ncbi:MAG: nucleotidyltransferase family protein [Candidatus Aenigmarchaeota archaeon]|nr:nucleotidyltransferase family protein [Candidatus Aenigmarchaeota archaeon]
MKAIILAGGAGTRLRPITYEIPKPLMPVHGRPLLEHIFDLLKKYSITDVLLSVGYLRERMMDYLDDGRHFGMHISYIVEKKPLGTAGPLKLARSEGKLPDSTFIVSNGDELKDINLSQMAKFHKENKALVTIALTRVDNPTLYGVADLRGDKIVKFVEKPSAKDAPSMFINSGLYMVEPKIIDFIPGGFSMLETDVFPHIARLGKLYGYKFRGQWFDTGSMDRYDAALKKWKGIKR